MDIILRRTVANLGGPGDVVNVKPGYAHNYLIPMNLAMPKTEENLRRIESEKAELAAHEAKLKSDAEAIRDVNKDLYLEFDMKSGMEGVLYGSVTSQDIAEALAEKGLEVDKKKLIIPDAIKRLGVYEVILRLHPEVDLEVKIIVDDKAGQIPEEITDELNAARKQLAGEAEDTVEVPDEISDQFLTDEVAEEADVETIDTPDAVEEPAEAAEAEKSGAEASADAAPAEEAKAEEKEEKPESAE